MTTVGHLDTIADVLEAIACGQQISEAAVVRAALLADDLVPDMTDVTSALREYLAGQLAPADRATLPSLALYIRLGHQP